MPWSDDGLDIGEGAFLIDSETEKPDDETPEDLWAKEFNRLGIGEEVEDDI
jgi:hypothetical protein